MSDTLSRPTARARCWISVVQAYQACDRQYSRMLAQLSLTIPQFDVLNVIAEAQGNATPALLADALMVTRGNITPLLRRLETRGWLTERTHPGDRRSLLLDLTPAGREVLTQARRASASFIDEQLSVFDDNVIDRTLNQMQTMRQHLERMDVDAVLRRANLGSP